MKTIKATQINPQMGKIIVFLRIDGKILYFKFNSNQYSEQMVSQMKQKGAIIERSKDNKWIKVDIFRDLELVKLGEQEFNPQELEKGLIEQILMDFYSDRYKKANFDVEVIEE